MPPISLRITLLPALQLYRQTFSRNGFGREPYAIVGLPIAPTDAEAQRLLITPPQRFLSLTRNQSVELKPPVDSVDGLWTVWEKQAVDARLRQAVVGSPETVRRKLAKFVKLTGVQEIFAVTGTFEQSEGLRSYSLLAEVVS